MVLTGLPWGYPRANLGHVSSIHRFFIIRLNEASIRLIGPPTAKPLVTHFFVNLLPQFNAIGRQEYKFDYRLVNLTAWPLDILVPVKIGIYI